MEQWCECQGKAQFLMTWLPLESLPESQGAAHPGDSDNGSSHSRELPLPRVHWCGQIPPRNSLIYLFLILNFKLVSNETTEKILIIKHETNQIRTFWISSVCVSVCVCVCVCVCVLVAQSCLIPCDPMDYSPSGSSVQGIFQAWILE